MKKLKKDELKPKSTRGMNDHLRICYNCQWRNNETGFCIACNEYCAYNKSGASCKLFRYPIDGPYKNWWFDDNPNIKDIYKK